MTSSLFRCVKLRVRWCCHQTTVMEIKSVMTSCVLIMVGLITGVAVNYHGLLFKAIHVQLSVRIKYVT